MILLHTTLRAQYVVLAHFFRCFFAVSPGELLRGGRKTYTARSCLLASRRFLFAFQVLRDDGLRDGHQAYKVRLGRTQE